MLCDICVDKQNPNKNGNFNDIIAFKTILIIFKGMVINFTGSVKWLAFAKREDSITLTLLNLSRKNIFLFY